MIAPHIESSGLLVKTLCGRILFKDLNLSLSLDKVAMVGRNGVGKSTLLRVLSGEQKPDGGSLHLRTRPELVDQVLNSSEAKTELLRTLGTYAPGCLLPDLRACGLPSLEDLLSREYLSPGQIQKLRLLKAKLGGSEFLLLDEPSRDLDCKGKIWLSGWLDNWKSGVLCVSHQPQILRQFQHFCIASESGCRYFGGQFSELERYLEQERIDREKRYLKSLNRMEKEEERTLHIARRRLRKKQYGRGSELDRCTSRATLNEKRSQAQASHGKMKRNREAKLALMREWTLSTRRSLQVQLPLVLPRLEAELAFQEPAICLQDVSVSFDDKVLFQNLNLELGNNRLALVGPNGAGKTTLLKLMLGHQLPTSGIVRSHANRVGSIEQGGADWLLEESLCSYLQRQCSIESPVELAELVSCHKFPLALAQRSMRSLSPGERVRAALICLYQQKPRLQLLLLDEPSYSLDLLGRRALVLALKAWPGGLVVASHDQDFLSEIGMDESFDQFIHIRK